MTTRRILLIAHDFPPMNGGGCPRPLAFARYLPEFGYGVTVLTRGSTCGRSQDHAPLDSLPASVRIERIDPDPDGGWNQYVANRLRWMGHVERFVGKPRDWLAEGLAWRLARRNPSWAQDAVWTRPAVRLGRELILQQRPEAIIATGPPFSSLKAGVLLSEQTGVPLIADYRDPWTYAYLWKPRSKRYAIAERNWEDRVMRQAALVIAVTPSMVERLRCDYPRHADKVQLLTNGYDDFPPEQSREGESDKLVIRHIGTFSGERQPNPIFDSAEVILQQFPEVAAELQIELVGPASPPLSPQINARRLNGLVADRGQVSLGASKSLMQTADVLIVCQPVAVASLAIPGKCYEYLKAQKPILAIVPADGDVAWLMRQTDGTHVIDGSDPQLIAGAMVKLWKSWTQNQLHVMHDPDWLATFHRRRLAGQLSEWLPGDDAPAEIASSPGVVNC